jgi:hypothetical protein
MQAAYKIIENNPELLNNKEKLLNVLTREGVIEDIILDDFDIDDLAYWYKNHFDENQVTAIESTKYYLQKTVGLDENSALLDYLNTRVLTPMDVLGELNRGSIS